MIRGKRISLRPIERDDLPRYIVWLNDAEVTYHLLPRLPVNLEDETDWYEHQRKAVLLKKDVCGILFIITFTLKTKSLGASCVQNSKAMTRHHKCTEK
jgi:hypothetical protein